MAFDFFSQIVASARNVRRVAPTIHNITNYVTATDCANVLLAFGASPIMADEPDEVAEIVALCGGLNVNLGTPNRSTIAAMFAAGRRAVELGIPATLDPVGVGASKLRTETAARLLSEIRFAAIRGNMSEIKTLATGTGATNGVDVGAADATDETNLTLNAEIIKSCAKAFGTVVVATGAIDLVSDGEKTAAIRNGSPNAARITGAGCMSSAVLCAFVAANTQKTNENRSENEAKNAVWTAAVAAISAFGVCQELAAERTAEKRGAAATFRAELIDAASTATPEIFAERAKIELL